LINAIKFQSFSIDSNAVPLIVQCSGGSTSVQGKSTAKIKFVLYPVVESTPALTDVL